MVLSFAHAESDEIGGQKSVAHPTQLTFFKCFFSAVGWVKAAAETQRIGAAIYVGFRAALPNLPKPSTLRITFNPNNIPTQYQSYKFHKRIR